MKIRVALLALLTTIAAARGGLAVEEVLTLSPEDTEISFFLKATGENVKGHLYLTAGEITFDAVTGEASGNVEIDAHAAETGNKKRDKKMHGKVLESDRFPLIEFTPLSIDGPVAATGASDPVLHGTVRIHGADHPLDLPAHIESDGEKVTLETEFEVPFVDWGMHDPSLFVLRVAKVVTVSIVAEGRLLGEGVDAEPAGRR